MAEVSGSSADAQARADISALQTALTAAVATIPTASTASPSAEAVSANPGSSMTRFVQEGHQHPRLTSTTMATIAAGSTVSVPFTRVFSAKPGMVMTEIEGDTTASAQPAIFKVQSWIQDASLNFTGCVVKVWRAQTVPQNLVSLLVGAVYNLFGASVVGTNFSVVAVARSDV